MACAAAGSSVALVFGTNTLVATNAAGAELARTSFDVACLAGVWDGSACSRLRYADLLFGFASENGYAPVKLEGADCA